MHEVSPAVKRATRVVRGVQESAPCERHERCWRWVYRNKIPSSLRTPWQECTTTRGGSSHRSAPPGSRRRQCARERAGLDASLPVTFLDFHRQEFGVLPGLVRRLPRLETLARAACLPRAHACHAHLPLACGTKGPLCGRRGARCAASPEQASVLTLLLPLCSHRCCGGTARSLGGGRTGLPSRAARSMPATGARTLTPLAYGGRGALFGRR